MKKPLIQYILLGIGSGIFVGFGGTSALMVSYGLSTASLPGGAPASPGAVKLLFGLLFPVALLLIVVAGGDLLTGNMCYCTAAFLQPPKPRYKGQRWRYLLGGFRACIITFCTNFLGCVMHAYFICYLGGLFSVDPWKSGIAGLVETKAAKLAAHEIFFRGIGCNFLVCMAVWANIACEDAAGKILSIWFIIATFAMSSYEHVVANMYFLPLGYWLGAKVTVGDLFKNLFLSLLGNYVGGGLFVGAWNYFAIGYEFAPKEAKQQLPVTMPAGKGLSSQGSSSDAGNDIEKGAAMDLVPASPAFTSASQAVSVTVPVISLNHSHHAHGPHGHGHQS
eukprot:tig00020685_g12922.t1